MKIAVSYNDGVICETLGDTKEFLVVTVKSAVPESKEIVACDGSGNTAVMKMINANQIDVLICGRLGIASRNALEILGVLIVPGCTGSANAAVAKFISGEKQGDASILEIAREEDPNDPMSCMTDCSKCSGCSPFEILDMMPPKKTI